MNDERFLKDWLDDTTGSTADSNSAVDRVVARLPETKQRSRWWPLWPGRRSFPEPTSRTRLMLNPVTAITAGVLTFAIGGTFLLSGAFDASVAPAPPAAEGDAEEIVPEPFSATWRWSHTPEFGEGEFGPGVARNIGLTFLFESVESSDPRFDGALVFTNNGYRYNEGGTEIQVGAARIETADGAWQEMPQPFLNFDRQPGDTVQRAFVGEGAYDGLIAFAVDTWAADTADHTLALEGFVIADEFPADPIPWYPSE